MESIDNIAVPECILEQRCEKRISVSLPAIAVLSGKSYSVLVQDLAQGGAMINVNPVFPVQTRFTLRCGSINAIATVAWQSTGRIGVRFDRLLNSSDVADQVCRSLAVCARRKLKSDAR